MRWLLIVTGVLMVLGGVIVAVALESERDKLKMILEVNTQLPGLVKVLLKDWIDRVPSMAVGVVVAALIASVPYFALAQILKQTRPPISN